MSYRLKTNVTAVEQGGQGRTATVGPDTDLSAPENAWVLDAISNPDVWDGEAPPLPDPKPAAQPGPAAAQLVDPEKLRLGKRVIELEARVAELTAELETARAGSAPAGGGQGVKVPPMRGSGSGAEEWRAYARSVEVEVADDASREDVVAALSAVGKPTK